MDVGGALLRGKLPASLMVPGPGTRVMPVPPNGDPAIHYPKTRYTTFNLDL